MPLDVFRCVWFLGFAADNSISCRYLCRKDLWRIPLRGKIVRAALRLTIASVKSKSETLTRSRYLRAFDDLSIYRRSAFFVMRVYWFPLLPLVFTAIFVSLALLSLLSALFTAEMGFFVPKTKPCSI